MKSKSAEQSSPLDTIKLLLALAVLIAGVVGFYYFESQSQLIRVPGILGAVLVAVGIFSFTVPGRAFWAVMRDSRTEVRKVVWPTRQEAVQTTLVVLVMVVIVAIFLWLLDMFLGWGFRQIMQFGG